MQLLTEARLRMMVAVRAHGKRLESFYSLRSDRALEQLGGTLSLLHAPPTNDELIVASHVLLLIVLKQLILQCACVKIG